MFLAVIVATANTNGCVGYSRGRARTCLCVPSINFAQRSMKMLIRQRLIKIHNNYAFVFIVTILIFSLFASLFSTQCVLTRNVMICISRSKTFQ